MSGKNEKRKTILRKLNLSNPLKLLRGNSVNVKAEYIANYSKAVSYLYQTENDEIEMMINSSVKVSKEK